MAEGLNYQEILAEIRAFHHSFHVSSVPTRGVILFDGYY